MTVAESDAPLWTALKARGIQWPADIEEVATDLGAAWHAAADGIGSGSTQVQTSGTDILAAWQDPAGGGTQARTQEIDTGLEAVQQQLRGQGDQATWYAGSLIRSKEGINKVVAELSPAYDWMPDPFNLNQFEQWFVDLILRTKKAIEDMAAEAIGWLLTVESEGPGVDGSADGPNATGRIGGLSGDASLDRGKFSALGGLLNGEYTAGLHGSVEVNAPGSGDPIVDANVQAGVRAALDPIDVVDAGPVKFSLQPEAYLGPGANLTVDAPTVQDGKLHFGFKAGASPLVGGSLGADVTIDLNEIGQSLDDIRKSIFG